MKHQQPLTAALLTTLVLPSLAHASVVNDAPASIDDAEVRAHVIVDREQNGRVVVQINGEDVEIVEQEGDLPFEVEFDAPLLLEEGLAMPEPVEATYLGVSSEAISAEVAKQIGLEQTTGLLLSFVSPGSPAAQAGLQSGDTLLKLNDQLLINPEQLAVLIRTFEPGDEITLDIFRDGEVIQATTKLGQSLVPPIGPGGVALDQPRWRVQPNAEPGVLPRELWQDIEPGMEIPAEGDMARAIEEMIQNLMQQQADQNDHMQELIQRLELNFDEIEDGFEIPGGMGGMHSQVTMDDGEHTITLTTNEQGKHLLIEDKEGLLIYDGPVSEDSTREEMVEENGLPDELFDKVQPLLNGNMFEFEFDFNLEGLPMPEQAPEEEAEPDMT